jgi:hypothetical protein
MSPMVSPESVDGSSADAEISLGLGERYFNGIEVGAIGRQEEEPSSASQCPNGASAFKRLPRRARPRRRIILVVVPVSSRKTSDGPPRACAAGDAPSTRHAPGARPGEASSVFLKNRPVFRKRPRQRGRMRPELAPEGQSNMAFPSILVFMPASTLTQTSDSLGIPFRFLFQSPHSR